MPYGSMEWGYGKHQLHGQVKPTGAGTGTSTGDTLYFTGDQWVKAVAAAVAPFGFNGNTQVLTQTLNVLTNATTVTKGSTDTDTTLSVIVAGRITKLAEAGIKPGDPVMVSQTAGHYHTHVQQWNGTATSTIVGRYVINVTSFHKADVAARTTQADDLIKIDFPIEAGQR
jgi:hypothetical protein